MGGKILNRHESVFDAKALIAYPTEWGKILVFTDEPYMFENELLPPTP